MQQIKRKNDGKGKYKLGRDIEAKQYTNNYGSGFYKNLSQDLKNEMPGVKGFSPTNLKYMSYFYKLYAPLAANRQQAADDFEEDLYKTSNPQPIGFSGILLAKRQNSFYCTYFLHNRNVADTKSPYPIKRLEVIRWFNQKSMVFNQSLS